MFVLLLACYVLLCCYYLLYVLRDIFFFKQKTAYEMRISDWSSDVCSSDLQRFSTNTFPPGREGVGRVALVVDREIRDEALVGEVGIERRDQIGRASCRVRVCQYV